MSDELRKILTEAGLDPRLHGGVDGAVLLLVGQRNEARDEVAALRLEVAVIRLQVNAVRRRRR